MDRRVRLCAGRVIRGLARLSQSRHVARAPLCRQVLLNAICIIAAGVVRATLPTTEFTLAWEHSVEKTRWEEHYQSDGHRLRLTRARIQSFGAGMEPPVDARLVDGWWTWEPTLEPLRVLQLTRSSYTRDYRLCWRARCSTLSELAGPTAEGEAVGVAACSGPAR